MTNTTLAAIIIDRMESARREMILSHAEANLAAVVAFGEAKDLFAAAKANPNDEIARLAYAAARREYQVLVEAAQIADRISQALTYGLGDLESGLSDCRHSARQLAAAVEAQKAA